MIATFALALLSTIPTDVSFAPWFTSHGVEVEIARQGGSAPWLRGTADLRAPADRVARAITDFHHYQEIFSPAIKKAQILEIPDETRARIHFVWPYPFPLRNRDAVVAYQAEMRKDGRIVLSWKDDSRPGDPHEGVRIEHVAGETMIEPLASGCRVTYTYLGELGGKFPAWAQEKAWREEPVQYIRAIRRRLGIGTPDE